MGKLIAIEGTDSSGKATQCELLVKNLEILGYKAKLLSFPVYDSPTGKIIAGPLLGKKGYQHQLFKEGFSNIDPKIACLYYAADRKYNSKDLEKYLEEYDYVILDRYISSNMAHQGGKIKDKDERFNMFEWIDRLEYWLLGLPKANMTILLHMPYRKSIELSKEKNNIDNTDIDEEYLLNSENCYIELSELYNWNVIECMDYNELKSIEDISKEIINIVLKDANKD